MIDEPWVTVAEDGGSGSLSNMGERRTGMAMKAVGRSDYDLWARPAPDDILTDNAEAIIQLQHTLPVIRFNETAIIGTGERHAAMHALARLGMTIAVAWEKREPSPSPSVSYRWLALPSLCPKRYPA